MPNQISSLDTVRALFVGAFPQQLTMSILESPSVAVYIKDDMRNMYYELADVRNITPHSCLKVYHKDPAQAFSQTPRPSNGDPSRMPREVMYAGQPPLRQPPLGPPLGSPQHHSVPGTVYSSTPPSPVPSSPSRLPFGPPRQASVPPAGTGPRLSGPQARPCSPGPSAILERRDVKPDEDTGSARGHASGRGPESLYADPQQLQEGRTGYRRASIRSMGSYGSGEAPDPPMLYRQRSRNSQLPTLGSKTPPPSPHRMMTDVRMIDIHGVHTGSLPHGALPHGALPHGALPLDRCTPARQSFRKEEVVGAKARGSMTSPGVSEGPQGPHPASGDPQTR
ncbi:hypothetical protein NHX12_021637 [Muraenolepis orangiensis]|uniref:Actin interacting protein 3-like C-terminal domain-containing protein n=1 Tax=Muraenolepis orangiensis TaxID=630683 RepID=A0A9Q0ISJ1_9TELE|nr:hypothetical protein NHX12_021637 [Muraenolepis orangiensis]